MSLQKCYKNIDIIVSYGIIGIDIVNYRTVIPKPAAKRMDTKLYLAAFTKYFGPLYERMVHL
jgi:hypothetical protein